MTRTLRLGLTHAAGVLLAAADIASVPLSSGDVLQAVAGSIVLGAVLGTGWMLAARVPANPIGWALLVVSCFALPQPLTITLGTRLASTHPVAAAWLLWFGQDWAWIPPLWTLLIWLPLRFPTGALPSPRWRWFSRLTIGTVVVLVVVFAITAGDQAGLPNPTAVPWADTLDVPLIAFCVVLLLGCVVGAVASLVVRSRTGGAPVRAQLRWMVWSIAIVPITIAGGFLVPASWTAYTPLTQAVWALIPVSIGIAVLRYRLYEIDRIVSRTAAYAIVTAVVLATYAAGVLLASSLVGDTVGTALGTLAAAGIALPLLRRVRRRVDRIFNRSQYDAERVVLGFGERIRNGADPHTAGADLLSAVETTLQPSAVGLWVRP